MSEREMAFGYPVERMAEASAAVGMDEAEVEWANLKGTELRALKRLTYRDVLLALLLLGLLAFATFTQILDKDRTFGFLIVLTAFSIAPPLILSGIEHLLKPAGPRKPAKVWWLHIQIMLANYAAAIPIGVAAMAIARKLVDMTGISTGVIDLRFATSGSLLLLFGAMVVSTLVGDFFFYWYHWLCHNSKFMWQHHKLHHMDPYFDALTGPRQNWLESLFSGIFISIPMFVLFRFDGVDPFHIGLYQGLTLGFAQALLFINHSNIRMQFGRASVILVSSQLHRIHHSYLPPHLDKNYAAFFPIWDYVFGTYYHPKKDEFPPTGVPNETEISSVLEAQIFPIREMYRHVRYGAKAPAPEHAEALAAMKQRRTN